MKAQMKAVMASAVVIVLALAAVSGVTYSWFSDSENTDISITTGVIDLDVEYSEFKLDSYNESSTTVSLGSQGTFPNGIGTFYSISNKTVPYKTTTEIAMDKMVPGDKVSFSMETISLKTDLDVHVGLDVIVYKGSTESIDNHPFKITHDDLSDDYPKGDYANLGSLNFTIELPTETGPECMDNDYSIVIILEAIQSAAVPSELSTFNFIENNGVLTANVESEVYGQKVTIVFTADDNSELNSSENYSLVVAPSDGSVLDDFGPNTKSISFELTDSNGGEISEGFTATVKLPVEDDVQNIVHISDSTKSIVPGVIFSENENIRYAEFTIDSFSDFVLFNGEISDSNILNLILSSEWKELILKLDDTLSTGFNFDSYNYQGKKLTITGSKNVVFDMSAIVANNQFVTGATLTFDGITLNYGKDNYMGLANTSSLTYNNCDINGLQFLYGDKVTFNNCNLNSNGAEHCVWTYGCIETSFNDCNFTYGDRGINCYKDQDIEGGEQTVEFQHCSFITSNTSSEGAVEINSSSFSKGIKVIMNLCDGPDYGEMVYISPWDKTDNPKTFITVDGVDWIFNASHMAEALIADSESISVILMRDIELPIGSLGTITGGSGEYKLGGEETDKITVDLNNKKLNIVTTYWSSIGAKNADAWMTFKNGTMTSSQETGTWNSYDLTFANCNIRLEKMVFEKAIALVNAEKTAELIDVTINETHDYYAMWISAEGQNVTIDGLIIDSEGRGIKIDEEYVDLPQKVTISIDDAEFKTNKKAAIMVKSAAGADIEIGDDVILTGVLADTINAVWVDEDAKTYASLVNVTGGNCFVEGSI